jgi:hypothetical protein
MIAACSSSSDQPGVGGGDASFDTYVAPPHDAAAPVDVMEAAAPLQATIRLVNLSPDLAPVDACVRAAPAEWVGPIFDGARGGTPDGAPPPPAVPFPGASDYVTIPAAGTLDVALVAGGSLNCGQPLALGHVTIDAGKRTTVVAMGIERADAGGSSSLTLAAFTDDPSVARDARVRVVHAALGDVHAPGGLGVLEVAVGGAPAPIVPLASGVTPGHTATSTSVPPVDALGYADVPPVADPAPVRITQATSDAGTQAFSTATTALGVAAGSVHSGFVASNGLGGVLVLWCDDVATPASCTALAAQ